MKGNKMTKEAKNEPVHVLHVVGNMGIGGIETLIMNIYRNIDRSKVQFDFLIHNPTEGEYADEIKRMGGKIYRMPVLRDKPHTYYWRYFEYKRALKRFFSEHPEIEIVHGHMTNTAAIYMPIAKKYGNVKCCIAHSHQSIATKGVSGVVTNILQRNLWKTATDLFSCSEKASHWIYPEDVIRRNEVKIIHNGIDIEKYRYSIERFKEERKKLGIDESTLVLGNVSRFNSVKNHSFMIDILEECIRFNSDTVLLLVGDGVLLDTIKKKVKKNRLEKNVYFLGLRSDVADIIQAFDVFILPSISEGLPVCAIEAQAAGLPVIASTGVTGETDITGNVTFLSLDYSSSEWAQKIIDINSSFKRIDTAEQVSKAGYDINQTAQWLQNFYLSKALEV